MAKAKPELHRTMHTMELACVAAVIAGCAMKILHWPGAAALIVAGGGSLALFYFPFGYRVLPAPKPTDQLPWLSWVSGAALCTALSGLVAFLQRWLFSGSLMLAGGIGCAVLVPVVLVMRYRHPHLGMYCDGLLVRSMIIGLLVLFLHTAFLGLPR